MCCHGYRVDLLVCGNKLIFEDEAIYAMVRKNKKDPAVPGLLLALADCDQAFL